MKALQEMKGMVKNVRTKPLWSPLSLSWIYRGTLAQSHRAGFCAVLSQRIENIF